MLRSCAVRPKESRRRGTLDKFNKGAAPRRLATKRGRHGVCVVLRALTKWLQVLSQPRSVARAWWSREAATCRASGQSARAQVPSRGGRPLRMIHGSPECHRWPSATTNEACFAVGRPSASLARQSGGAEEVARKNTLGSYRIVPTRGRRCTGDAMSKVRGRGLVASAKQGFPS